MCLPSDGPAPALVTYERRPRASTSGSPRLGHEIPQLRALLDRDVELPAELAHVRDARSEHPQRVELDRPAARERETLVRDIVRRQARQDVPRPWPPEAECRPRRRQVGEL